MGAMPGWRPEVDKGSGGFLAPDRCNRGDEGQFRLSQFHQICLLSFSTTNSDSQTFFPSSV